MTSSTGGFRCTHNKDTVRRCAPTVTECQCGKSEIRMTQGASCGCAEGSSLYAARPLKSLMDNNSYVSKISLLSSSFTFKRTHPVPSCIHYWILMFSVKAEFKLPLYLPQFTWTLTRSCKYADAAPERGAVCFSLICWSSEALIKSSFDCIVYFDKKMPSRWMMPLISCASDLGCSSRQGRWLQHLFSSPFPSL